MGQGVQRFPRTKMVLPLRVWPDPDADEISGLQLAYTVDISPIGGRLGGLRNQLRPGQTILLQRGQKRAQFRVIWNTELAPGENQAGIEALEHVKNIWGIELPQAPGRGNVAPISQAHEPSETGLEKRALPSRVAGWLESLNPFMRDRRVLWAAGVVLLIASGILALSIYHQMFHNPTMALHPPQPMPPAGEVTWVSAKPHAVATVDSVSTWHLTPVPRIDISEAPTKHMVYPVSPDVKVSGKVMLSLLIGVDGRVKQIQVLSGKPLLAEAAQSAVRQWRYIAYQVKGEPAEGEAKVVVAFRGSDAVSLEFPASTSAAN